MKILSMIESFFEFENKENELYSLFLFFCVFLIGMIFGFNLSFIIQISIIIYLFSEIFIQIFKVNIDDFHQIKKIKIREVLFLIFILGIMIGNFSYFIDFDTFSNVIKTILDMKFIR